MGGKCNKDDSEPSEQKSPGVPLCFWTSQGLFLVWIFQPVTVESETLIGKCTKQSIQRSASVFLSVRASCYLNKKQFRLSNNFGMF